MRHKSCIEGALGGREFWKILSPTVLKNKFHSVHSNTPKYFSSLYAWLMPHSLTTYTEASIQNWLLNDSTLLRLSLIRTWSSGFEQKVSAHIEIGNPSLSGLYFRAFRTCVKKHFHDTAYHLRCGRIFRNETLRGNVTLFGDAAYVMSPTAGAGATTALFGMLQCCQKT